MSLESGQLLSHYRLVEKIGKGGMGVVWKARDEKLQRNVALKVLPPGFLEDLERRKRLLREARAAAAVNHPNICTVYEVDEVDEIVFIVMELVQGDTLGKLLSDQILPIPEAIRIAIEMADGLVAAHRARVIHRDLKPQNVLIRSDGLVKILDFGVAKLWDHQSSLRPARASQDLTATQPLTWEGKILGTPAYMSPEQARGNTVDSRSDIFSFGVTLYEMLARRRPFEKNTPVETLAALLSETPSPVSSTNLEVPAAVERILDQCLQKDPKARYQSAQDLLSQLKSARAGIESKGLHPEAVGLPAPPSIAVLPFVNMSSDPDNEYFSDGLAEELINALSKLEGLGVAARTSTFRFRGAEHDIREIGGQLNVGTVLEGSVRKAGSNLRITAQLIDVSNGYHIWSERYDRELHNVFEIQDEIVLVIVDKLKVKLLGGEKEHLVKRSTNNPRAFNLYLKGRYHLNKRTDASLRKSLDHFEHALTLDPTFAVAHAGMADAYVALGWHNYMPGDLAFQKAKQEAVNALRIDDQIGEAYCSLGLVKELYEWDWAGAKRDFERAISLKPSDAETRHQYAHLLAILGRCDEALLEMKRALDLEPLSLVISSCYGQKMYYARDFDAAIKQHEKTIEMDPNFYVPHLHIGYDYEQKQMFQEAATEFELAMTLSGGILRAKGALAHTYARSGRESEAKTLLRELKEQLEPGDVATYVALIYFGLGDDDQGFEWLNEAYTHRHSYLIYLTDPMWDKIRSDSRFQELCMKMALGGSSATGMA